MTEEDVDKYVAEFPDHVDHLLGGVNGIRQVDTSSPGDPEIEKNVCVKIGKEKFCVRPICTNGHAKILDFLVDKEIKGGAAVATAVSGLDVSKPSFVTKNFILHDLNC
uniref:Uncharacterized protein n=2 Tax=Helicotheca tamesis TaxID=374047 RepID=A0A7S2IAT1_9STRA|mmetsp:Transcript_7057/g.9552  ORF Transcript_7057/g.9552 Transcript_7057/m.9552 type:complete len:108 (+) Transcript_7057:183-506(+)